MFKLDLDGRQVNVPNYENGNFVGPTILSGVKVSNHAILTSNALFFPRYEQHYINWLISIT